MRGFTLLVRVFKATVTVVDVDSGAEEKMAVSSQGSATGLNLKENQRIYFGGLPSIANYRYAAPTATMERRKQLRQLLDEDGRSFRTFRLVLSVRFLVFAPLIQ